MISDLPEDAFLLAYTIKTIAAFDLSPKYEQYREYILWHMMVSGRRTWGRHRIEDVNIEALQLLSDRIGGWIYIDAERGETFIPLAEWQQQYAQSIQDYPDILRFF